MECALLDIENKKVSRASLGNIWRLILILCTYRTPLVAQWMAFVVPIALILAGVGNEVLGYYVMDNASQFYKATVDQDTDIFFDALWKAALLSVFLALFLAAKTSAGDLWALHLRTRGTRYFQKRYFPLLVHAIKIDNSDHRICEDIRLFSQAIADITVQICLSPGLLIFYTTLVWKALSWPAVLMCYGYFFIGLLPTYPFVRRLAKLTYEREQKEGNFRFQHAMQRDRAEDIIMLKGSAVEELRAEAAFLDIYKIRMRIVKREFGLETVVQFLAYIGTTVNFAAVCIAILWINPQQGSGGDTAASVSMHMYTCLKLINAFSNIFKVAEECSHASGFASRLCELKDVLKNDHPPPVIGENTSFMTAESLTIGYDEPLLSDLSMTFYPGVHVLFTGSSGVGKTTLMRVLSGSLHPLSGEMHHCLTNSMNFVVLTQHPYLPKSSIWELLHYPNTAPPITPEGYEEAQGLLRSLGLKWSPEDVQDWLSMISPGEAQRLACLRAYWNEPEIYFIDEGTSHVDEDMEATMYQMWLYGRGNTSPTIISFGHNRSLKKFHHQHVHLVKNESKNDDEMI